MMDDDLFALMFMLAAGGCCAWIAWLAWRARAPDGVERRIRSAARAPVAAARMARAAHGGSGGATHNPGVAGLQLTPALARWWQSLRRRWRVLLWLRRLMTAAGSSVNVNAFLVWSTGLGLSALLLAEWFDAPSVITLATMAGASLLPLMRLLKRRGSRWQAIEAQLPESLDGMARAMQAGQAFSRALRAAGQEGPQPIAQEWRSVADEINFGLSEEAALTNLAVRVPLPDVRYFAAAVLIQREAGGNLAQLLTNLSALVRERSALRGAVRVMSAEGRISAWILGTMPFVIAALVSVMNPKFLSVLWTDPLGTYLVWAALSSMTLGVLWMRSVIRVQF